MSNFSYRHIDLYLFQSPIARFFTDGVFGSAERILEAFVEDVSQKLRQARAASALICRPEAAWAIVTWSQADREAPVRTRNVVECCVRDGGVRRFWDPNETSFSVHSDFTLLPFSRIVCRLTFLNHEVVRAHLKKGYRSFPKIRPP